MRLELTRRGDYAVRAMLALAAADAGGWTSAPRIAGAMAIPERFLPRVLRDLARAGLIEAHAGRSGGYRLARPASARSACSTSSTRSSRPSRRRAASCAGSRAGSTAVARSTTPSTRPGSAHRARLADASLAELAAAVLTAARRPAVPGKTGRMAPVRDPPGRPSIQIPRLVSVYRAPEVPPPCVGSFPLSCSRPPWSAGCASSAAPGWTYPPDPPARRGRGRRPRRARRLGRGARGGRDHDRHRGVRPRVHAGPADRRRARALHRRTDQHRARRPTTSPSRTGRRSPPDRARPRPVEVDVPAGGLSFICSIPGHEQGGMTGTIGVTGGAAAAASPAALARRPRRPRAGHRRRGRPERPGPGRPRSGRAGPSRGRGPRHRPGHDRAGDDRRPGLRPEGLDVRGHRPRAGHPGQGRRHHPRPPQEPGREPDGPLDRLPQPARSPGTTRCARSPRARSSSTSGRRTTPACGCTTAGRRRPSTTSPTACSGWSSSSRARACRRSTRSSPSSSPSGTSVRRARSST